MLVVNQAQQEKIFHLQAQRDALHARVLGLGEERRELAARRLKVEQRRRNITVPTADGDVLSRGEGDGFKPAHPAVAGEVEELTAELAGIANRLRFVQAEESRVQEHWAAMAAVVQGIE